MTWVRDRIAPAPHLLDPAETEKAAAAYFRRSYGTRHLTEEIARHKCAIEHEQAILRGMELVLRELDEAAVWHKHAETLNTSSGKTCDPRTQEGTHQ